MTDLTPPDDPAETIDRLTVAARRGDCIRIAHLAWARTIDGSPFTRDDILTDWLMAWPHHQNPPFRRRPLQRLNIAWPILYATGLLEPVSEEDPDLLRVRWNPVVQFLSERIGYAIQQEAVSKIDDTVPFDDEAIAALTVLVEQLYNTAAAMDSSVVLTVEAEVIKGDS